MSINENLEESTGHDFFFNSTNKRRLSLASKQVIFFPVFFLYFIMFLFLQLTKTITRQKNRFYGHPNDPYSTPFSNKHTRILNATRHTLLTQHDTQSHSSGNKSARTKTQKF